MNCDHVQQQLDDLARGRLDEATNRALRQHLADCTDCRVQQQRQARLQRLLALKRYEQPTPAYFDSVTTEFHRRRQRAADRPSLAERLLARVGLDSFWQPGYGWAAAGVALAVVSVSWIGWQNSRESLLTVQTLPPLPARAVVARTAPPADSFVSPHLTLVSSDPAAPSERSPASLVELIAAGRSQPSPPRYVLDRIAITPAHYEMADANF